MILYSVAVISADRVPAENRVSSARVTRRVIYNGFFVVKESSRKKKQIIVNFCSDWHVIDANHILIIINVVILCGGFHRIACCSLMLQ